jgi:hypothetical protein
MTDHDEKEPGPSEFAAAHGVVDQQTGQPMPTPDPKDQTGDPEADNPALQELRKRHGRREITES